MIVKNLKRKSKKLRSNQKRSRIRSTRRSSRRRSRIRSFTQRGGVDSVYKATIDYLKYISINSSSNDTYEEFEDSMNQESVGVVRESIFEILHVYLINESTLDIVDIFDGFIIDYLKKKYYWSITRVNKLGDLYHKIWKIRRIAYEIRQLHNVIITTNGRKQLTPEKYMLIICTSIDIFLNLDTGHVKFPILERHLNSWATIFINAILAYETYEVFKTRRSNMKDNKTYNNMKDEILEEIKRTLYPKLSNETVVDKVYNARWNQLQIKPNLTLKQFMIDVQRGLMGEISGDERRLMLDKAKHLALDMGSWENIYIYANNLGIDF